MIELMYFNDEEFRKATPSCSLSDMDEEFMKRIDEARLKAGVPFIVNSAYRTVKYEKKHKRTGNSMHTKGKAMDIRCITNDVRYRIICSLIDSGFRRIGIGKTFIHVDSGYPDATNPIIWLY